MDTKKLAAVCNSFVHLMALHKKQDELMKRMIRAILQQHLKESGASMTVYEWNETNAAIKMWTGEGRYTPNNGWYRQTPPTHLRLKDLKPVVIKEGKGNFEGMCHVLTPKGEKIASVMPSFVDEHYLNLKVSDGG